VEATEGVWKTMACARLGLLVALEREAIDEAVVWFQRALETDPKNARLRCLLAWGLMRSRRWDDALRECRSLSGNGHAGIANLLRAQIAEQRGEKSRAAALLARAMR